MIIDASKPAYRRPKLGTVPAGDHLTRGQRADANRWAALGYYYTGRTDLGFQAQAPSVAGVSPVPAFGMLTDEQNAALTASARMALVNVPYYRNAPQQLIDSIFPQFNPGTAYAAYSNYVPGARAGAVPNFSAIYAGPKAGSEVPFHEISHRMDYRFGSPSQTAGFTSAANAAATSNPTYGNRLGLYGGFGRGAREVYADNPSRLFLGSVPPELKAYYPWLR